MQVYECSPHEPVKNQFLTLAFDIYVNERRFWTNENMEKARGCKQWRPIDQTVFDPSIKLSRVELDPEVIAPAAIHAATFEVKDCSVTVDQSADPELYEGEFMRGMLGDLQESFYGHPHDLCLRALRQKLVAERMTEDGHIKGRFGSRTKLVNLRGLDGRIISK